MLSFRRRSRLIQNAITRTQETFLKFLIFPALNVFACLPKQDLALSLEPSNFILLLYSREPMAGRRRSAVRPIQVRRCSFPYPQKICLQPRARRGTPSPSAKRTIKRAMTLKNRWASKKTINGVVRTKKKRLASLPH